MTFVLASSYAEYCVFLHRFRIPPSHSRYIATIEHVLGLRNVKIFALSGWGHSWCRRGEYGRLMDYINSHEIKIVDVERFTL